MAELTAKEILRRLEGEQYVLDVAMSQIDLLTFKKLRYQRMAEDLAQRQELLRERLERRGQETERFPEQLRQVLSGAGAGADPSLNEVRVLLAERVIYDTLQQHISERFFAMVSRPDRLQELQEVDVSQPDARERVKASLNATYLTKLGERLRQLIKDVERKIPGEARRPIRAHLYGVLETFRSNARATAQSLALNFILMGPPGTGKTSVARVMAEFFSTLGVLVTDQVRTISRSDLVGAYVGQSAPKTRETILGQLESVVFLDEAYSLLNCEYEVPGDPMSPIKKRDTYGGEAMDQVTELLTNVRGSLCFIAAGYEKEMQNCFLGSNTGLPRRFPNKWVLKPFTEADLLEIFRSMLQRLDDAKDFWFQSGRQVFARATQLDDTVDALAPLILACNALGALTAQAGDLEVIADAVYAFLTRAKGSISMASMVLIFNMFLSQGKRLKRTRIRAVNSEGTVVMASNEQGNKVRIALRGNRVASFKQAKGGAARASGARGQRGSKK